MHRLSKDQVNLIGKIVSLFRSVEIDIDIDFDEVVKEVKDQVRMEQEMRRQHVEIIKIEKEEDRMSDTGITWANPEGVDERWLPR
jgi:hypothetical protein